ncbi:MAG: hypothetical protein AAF718_03460 [Pseudomonadota bacterium]
MLDFNSDLFDMDRLQAKLAKLTDAELAALEDDLDFCNFTGVPTLRVLEVLEELTDLDQGWKKMLDRKTSPEVPVAY